jgi:hypothetical protein
MERLLQILECLAEDELFMESDVEIEQLEKIIQSSPIRLSEGDESLLGEINKEEKK